MTKNDELNLHDTTDAAIWAAEFCKRWPSALCQIPDHEGVSDGDDFEGTMIGWFANAIMAGVDSEARKQADLAALVEAELDAPNRYAYKVGVAVGSANAYRQGLEDAAKVADKIMRDYAKLTYSPQHDRMQNAAKTYCAGEIAAAIRAKIEKETK
jgi:hypothetical protein